ncbi:hypothetical protein [Rhodoferax sp. GW822-FHT02A01]|uniref:hypothetical protein n=1 Tax=Rhodoferax sp. GW822-FHT02A01 TaxID=3141537 RepID=UPI00315CB60C
MSHPVPSSQPPAPARAWPRWLRRNTLELVACAVIGLGLLMLLQPFALVLYTWSFITMLAGTVMFMVVSKFPE